MSLRAFDGWPESLISTAVDGVAVTAAAATTLLPPAGLFTLPQNFFSAPGKKLQIKASGRATTVATTPGTFRFDVRFGGTVVFDSLAIALVVTNAYTNVGWWLDIELTSRLIGAVGNCMGQGTFTSPNVLGSANVAMPIGGVTAMLPWNTAPAVGGNFITTAAQQVDLFFTQTAATGSFQLHQFELIAKN